MKARTRRRVRRPPDLTSLFDVLFIVVFVALIRAAAAQHAEAEALKPVPRPVIVEPVPLPPSELKVKALAAISSELAQRAEVIVRISAAGIVTALEADGKTHPLDVPLLEASTDPLVRMTYLGERSAQLRLCRIATLELGAENLERYVVIFAPARLRADRQAALNAGMDRDVVRCLVEQRGIATIVEPTP